MHYHTEPASAYSDELNKRDVRITLETGKETTSITGVALVGGTS
jgi:hypothetical protein